MALTVYTILEKSNQMISRLGTKEMGSVPPVPDLPRLRTRFYHCTKIVFGRLNFHPVREPNG